ncbi:choice-of-anchor B domain-containing protein [Reichenbachiella faecimaris]|uniref:Choice-of-anchor B domain-containing protein n=1 Tax=Reichenbachiella faecimaris TaxID=692418 RepID=A0A1W2GBW2_REIFA|nr:choice-of-anchor B family protein [Reichenbachiella faecimaris]SMD34145.1 choice-of-anchor B domain-containing protein [Reichenbachiella faecimaris]
MIRLTALVLFYFLSANLMAQTPCVDGMAGDYPCQNVTLLGHLSTDDLLAELEGGIYLNDIWGWTDPDTNKEYAIVGMANGTSFVDITDPTDPIMLGMLPEHNSIESSQANSSRLKGGNSVWRDMKVYKNHAYIVSEDPGHGMQVFDLTDLRDLGSPDVPYTFTEAGHYDGIGDAHNIVINEETGFAYVVGARGASTCGSGGLHIVNIQDPKNPVYEACFDNDGYTHDAQCVVYNGPDTNYVGKEICFNSNEESVTIVDVDDKTELTMIATVSYEGVKYTHQGWLTEDHRYFISNDELDEINNVTSTTKTFIWDVQDLDNPVLIEVYDHRTGSIDHNLYIVDDMMYQSNYTAGLRVFDVSQVDKGFIREAGYFDTYPTNDNVSWLGSWSNYPFFESGTIAVSDITNGLFLLAVDYSSTYIVHQPEDFEGCEEEEIHVWFEVAGDGLNYQWQYDLGSGFVDIDNEVQYSNINSNVLIINEGHVDQNGLNFRCVATDGEVEYVSESAVLTLNNKPTPAFEFIVTNNNVVFSNTSVEADTYEWDFGDGSSKSTFSSPSHSYPLTSDSYTVVLTAGNGCGTRSIEKGISLVVTHVESTPASMVIYPNPTHSFIQIRTGKGDEWLRYTVLNACGQVVLYGKTNSGEGQAIDASSLFAGIYLIEIEDNKGNKVREKLLVK